MSNSGSSISEVQLRKQQISAAKKAAEIVTLREWYDSTQNGYELEEYFRYFANLGRLGKKLHKGGVKRVTELYEAENGVFVAGHTCSRELIINIFMIFYFSSL